MEDYSIYKDDFSIKRSVRILKKFGFCIFKNFYLDDEISFLEKSFQELMLILKMQGLQKCLNYLIRENLRRSCFLINL